MPPGHRFELSSGAKLDLSIDLQLTVRDPVEYLDVIYNNQHSMKLDWKNMPRKGVFRR